MDKSTSVQAEEPAVENTSRLRNFRINHPRTAKVVGIIAIAGATLGAGAIWKNRMQVERSTEKLAAAEDEETSS